MKFPKHHAWGVEEKVASDVQVGLGELVVPASLQLYDSVKKK